MASSTLDAKRLRFALGQFPTGVCVVTCRVGEELVGMTMSSFNSLSLDPPLVLFSVDRRANSLPLWQRATGYVINVLSDDQRAVSNAFAKPKSDKWSGVQYDLTSVGAPRLRGVAASFECCAAGEHDGGDHVLFIARVKDFAMDADRVPLVFAQGRYAALESTNSQAELWPLDIHY